MAQRSGVGSGCVVVALVAMAFVAAAAKAWLAFALAAAVGIGWTLYDRHQRTSHRDRLLAKYGDEALVRRLLAGEFWQGQTGEQLQDSLGHPSDIDEQVMKTKTKQVWKYNQTGRNRYGLRITVENGQVVGWDDKR